MNAALTYIRSSIGRKQIVAVTGLGLIIFLIGHLAGNLIIFLGPEAFNAYAGKMASLRPGLYVLEAGLLLIFLIHIWFTALIVLNNIRARGGRYAVKRSEGERSLATRLMPYTGTIILAFVVWHIYDFTLVDKHGPRSILADGQSHELYGIVVNSFRDPFHSLLYIIAMICVGFHLVHGVESFIQTFGWNHPRYTPIVKRFSEVFGMLIAGGFSLIPVIIYFSFL